VVTDALPNAELGNRVLVLSAWLHYGRGNTLSQIVEVFDHHLQMKLTPGGNEQTGEGIDSASFLWVWLLRR